MFWLGILAIAFVAGVCGEQSSMTTLMMYEDDSCTSPATTVGMWQELACVPQNDRENPVCERSGESYAVSDCMDYGSVFYEAFYANETWHPFVYVEKYDASAQGSWWCQQDTLENATAYRLDGPPGACYVHHSGTTSSKIAIDQSLLTYTTYSDPSCNDVVSKTQTTWSMAMNAHCSNSLRIGIIGLSTSDMKAVTVFDESQCSETPVKLTLTYGFECTIGNQDDVSSQCEPTGSSHYSISNCTSGYYSDYTTNTFGNYTPHLIMQEWDNSNCNGFQNVTAYIADGICHSNTDDTTSFKVTITADSTAEITTYLDTDCGAVGNSTTVTKRQLLSQSCILHRDCDNIYGCGRSFSVGGFGSPASRGKVTTLMTYEDDSCTSSATTVDMWQELACVPQNDRENPVCERSGESYAVSDCMDYGSVFYEAFYANETWHPFVYVEKYDASAQGSWWCQQDTLENATAYRLDGPPGACYVHHSGTTSSKIAIDQSLLTYTTYSDPSCNDVVSKTQTTWSMAMNAHCSNSLRIGIIGLSTSDMKAVTVFDESQCSETPVKLTLTYGFECTIGNQDDVSSQCEPTGSSHYSISNCTSGYYSDYTTNTFGNYTPHLIMQEWDNSNCNGFQNVTAYIADGICHSNTDDTTSFKVTITADSTAEITTYLDTDCGAVGNSTTVTKRQLLSQSCILHRDCDNIYGCGRSFSVGGFDSPPTGMVSALLVFDDSSCAGTPVQLVISNGVPCSTSEASTCEKISVGGNKRFGYRDCISDVVKQTAAVFGDTSYVVMEEYVDGTTCKAIKGTVVYKADGNCHPSIVDGTYFKISPSLDSSLTFATYPNSFCNAFDADYITVGTKYINFDACYEGNMKLFTNMPASSVPTNPTTPVTDVDLMTREQIMFPEWLWEPSPRRVFESD